MARLMTRRLFVSLPLAHGLLTSTPASIPVGTPIATPHGTPVPPPDAIIVLPGGAESSYTSPSFGWSMEFDHALWRVVTSTSNDSADLLTLEGTGAGASSAIITFHTSPLGDDTSRQRLREAADNLDNAFPNATIEIAVDDQGHPIDDHEDLFGDQMGPYWLASYIARHTTDASQDRIIELDSIEIPSSGGVLVITAISSPDDYWEQAFDLFGTLRSSIVIPEEEVIQSETDNPSSGGATPEGGGSRPRVQY